MSARIAVVGGGSYHWAPRLLADFANTPSLTGVEVVLHDLDAERMKRMEELGNAIAQRRAIPMTVRSEGDRRSAVRGADFVITAFSVGGFDSMQHDIEIPQRYGIRQPIGDSVGPGGILRALRSIPVLGGVNHFPIATELRVAGEDGFARLRALLADPEQMASAPIWMDPPEQAQWQKIATSAFWSKLDVVANNRVRFGIFERFGVLP